MKLLFRIFISLFITLAIIFYFFIDFIRNDIGTKYVQAVEESLVDTANIFAVLIESDLTSDKINTIKLKSLFAKIDKRVFDAKIYKLFKTKIDLDIYVVDSKGIVIFDSLNESNIGKDFSKWNDVYLTLQGKYGARLTKMQLERDIYEAEFEGLYVAAPIKYKDKIIGAVTVVKPKDNINKLKELTRIKVIYALILAFVLFLGLIVIMSFWITNPILKLINYVRSIKTKKTYLPDLGNTEIRELGKQFEKIFTELEGKKYIEQYIQTLTHEIKSPLSSIIGASELLEDKMPENEKLKFYNNIKIESKRIENLVNRLLELASLENRNKLKDITDINFYDLMDEIIISLKPQIEKKEIKITNNLNKKLIIRGELFLIRHCFSNLLDNAVKFSFINGIINIYNERKNDRIIIYIKDNGEGIPEFALDKIFNKFYSLPPKDSVKKSTGLGLSFVKEVLKLHNGDINIINNEDNGVTVIVSL